MNETMRVFALLGDAALRRKLQQHWRGNGTTLCGMHSEGGDSIVEELGRVRPDAVLVDADVDGARPVVQSAASRLRLPVVAIVRAQQQRSRRLPAARVGRGVARRTRDELPVELVTRIENGLAKCATPR